MNNNVRFGVITKVCKGYAFARVMDNAGTVTAKEVFLGNRQFVVVDEERAVPYLTDTIDEKTEPKSGDYIAFLYNINPVHRGGSTPAYKWGILSNHDSVSSGGYNGPLMESDSLESGSIDPEIERLARSTCGQNGVKHHRPDQRPAYSSPHRGVANRSNPNQRRHSRQHHTPTSTRPAGLDHDSAEQGQGTVSAPSLKGKGAPVYTVS